MKWILSVCAVLSAVTAGAVVASGPAEAAPKSEIYREVAGAKGWGKKFALRKGYLRGLSQRLKRLSPELAQQVEGASRRLHGASGKLRGCWGKARLALANIAVSGVFQPRVQMGKLLQRTMAEFNKAITGNDWAAVATAVEAAQWRLQRAFDRVQKRLGFAARWLRRSCSQPGRGKPALSRKR